MSFTTLFNVLSILGGIAFLYLFWIQMRDYRRHLCLLVTFRDCQPTGKGTSLILMRLSFVNPSSQGRTVYGIDAESKSSGTRLKVLNPEVVLSLQNVTFRLSNVSRQVPFAETLQFPLDIPPNQSLSRWLAVEVAYPEGIHPQSGIYIHMVATQPIGKATIVGSSYRSAKKKELAHVGAIVFPLREESQTVDIYRDIQTPPTVKK